MSSSEVTAAHAATQSPSVEAPGVDVGELGRVAGAALVVRQVGECRRPVRLVGSRLLVSGSTGAVLSRLDSGDLPDGVLKVRCGTRRAKAALNAFDVTFDGRLSAGRY